jgi:Alcohol dehydrogenase GroES-like domain
VSTAGSSSVEPPQLEQVSGREKKRANEMMPAVLLDEQRQFVFGQRPVPAPRPDQVLIEVDLCGICGSDLHAADLPQVYGGLPAASHLEVARIFLIEPAQERRAFVSRLM